MTLRLTESDLVEIQRRRAGWAQRFAPEPRRPKLAGSKKVGPKPKARGMNKWETEFSQLLEARKQSGEIVWWAFEPFRIRIANDCWYRPDFVTVDAAGKTSVWEVKGFMREAARVRLKVAVEKLPYPFYLVRKHKGELRVTPV